MSPREVFSTDVCFIHCQPGSATEHDCDQRLMGVNPLIRQMITPLGNRSMAWSGIWGSLEVSFVLTCSRNGETPLSFSNQTPQEPGLASRND